MPLLEGEALVGLAVLLLLLGDGLLIGIILGLVTGVPLGIG